MRKKYSITYTAWLWGLKWPGFVVEKSSGYGIRGLEIANILMLWCSIYSNGSDYDVTLGCVAMVLQDMVQRTGLLLPRSSSNISPTRFGHFISQVVPRQSFMRLLLILTSVHRKLCSADRQSFRPNQLTWHGEIYFKDVIHWQKI